MENKYLSDKILELEKEEDFNIDFLRDTVLTRERSLLFAPDDLARFLLLNDRHGLKLFDGAQDWSNLPDGISLINQLLISSKVIVDLKPGIRDLEEFTSCYGLTPAQMIRLARRKKIAINLLGYDSTRPEFQSYRLFNSSDEHELAAYADLFSYGNGMRIIAKRRNLFFELLNRDKKELKDFDQEGRAFFDRIKKLPAARQGDLLNNGIFRSHTTIDQLITSLSRQYGYNKKISNLNLCNPDLALINKTILGEFDLGKPESIVDVAILLRGMKVLMASPYTASMGGIYNLSQSSLKALAELEKVFSDDLCAQLARKTVPENLQATSLEHKIKEELLNALSGELKTYSSDTESGSACLDMQQFDCFLKFIEDSAESIRIMEKTVQSLAANPFFTEERVLNIGRYFKEQHKVLEGTGFKKAVNVGINTGFTAGALLFLDVDSQSNILGTASISAGVAYVTERLPLQPFYNMLFNHFLATKHRAMADIGLLKKELRKGIHAKAR